MRDESGTSDYYCLDYRVHQEKPANQELMNVVDEQIPYCFRVSNEKPADDYVNPFATKMTFEEMRLAGTTVRQLLSWSAPYEVVERYGVYLNEPKPALNEVYYNCTPPRFGPLCQYSFEFGEGRSFNEIVESNFRQKDPYSESSDRRPPVACYVLIECHRNGKPWCLDWREICDGKIDCFDEGSDEEFCPDMKKHQCGEDEFRCRNGQCISKDLVNDPLGEAECLDGSDENIDVSSRNNCYQDPTFRCEEHTCDPGYFSCGDGQCVLDIHECANGRQELLLNSNTARAYPKKQTPTTTPYIPPSAPKVNHALCETWLYDFMDTGIVPLQSSCDGIQKYFYDEDGYEHKDESKCPCSSCSRVMHTRCDGYWHCNDKNHCAQTMCPMGHFGEDCRFEKFNLTIDLIDIPIPSYVVAYFFTLSNKSDPVQTYTLRKLTFFQRTIIFHTTVPLQLVIIKADENFYLAILQQIAQIYISNIINPAQHCISVKYLLNQTVLNMIPRQRFLYFDSLCQNNLNLTCFIDKTYLCLCTIDHDANCLPFNPDRNFQCPSNDSCDNHGQCLQDHQTCPSIKFCLCPSCFFGNRCQFYAKGLGATLDQILGHEIKPNTNLTQQNFPVKLSATLSISILAFGSINAIVSILVFSRKASKKVGCGIYILTSSISSFIIIILYSMKFFFLFLSNQHLNGQSTIFQTNCFTVEPLLKFFIHYSNWLNSFVAIERFISATQRASFKRNQSKRIAKWVIFISFVIIACSLIPLYQHLEIFNDKAEATSWCVVKYVKWIETYDALFIYIHYLGPFLINLISMILITTITAYQKYRAQPQHSYYEHMLARLKKHRHILFSTFIVIALTLPHLIISFRLTCAKSSEMFWSSLIVYYLSFCPATFTFAIFVIPSPLYRKQFLALIADIRKFIRL